MKKSWLFLTALFVSISATASIDALNFASPDQEKDYHQLTQELRCPQCQNNNIADSNATIAVDMRGKVFELLQEGKNRNEVVDYMIQRYGNFVTYDPPMTMSTIVLWIAPILLVLIGILFIFKRKSKSPSAVNSDAILDDEENVRLSALLKEKDK